MKTPPGLAEPLEPALDFLQHLWSLNHALERMSLHMERTLGVTAQQRLFVRCIGKFPGITASQLAAVLHLDRGTVSVGLSRMSRKGLVSRRRDPGDRRRVSLALTAKGEVLNRPHPDTVEHGVEALLAKLGPTDSAKVKAALRALAASLIRQVEQAAPAGVE